MYLGKPLNINDLHLNYSDLGGAWSNQRGSIMNLNVTQGTLPETYKLNGLYVTGEGTPHESAEYELVGCVTQNIIGFTVNFGTFGSISSWTGYYMKDESGEKIKTLWHLARLVPDPENAEHIWSETLTGSDIFVRVG